MNKQILVLTVGLPRSGKSTWARDRLSSTTAIVNPDAIRLAMTGKSYVAPLEDYVWAIAKTMVEHHFSYGYEKVILDATNIGIKRIAPWIPKNLEELCERYLDLVFIDTPMDECLLRAKNNQPLIEVINRQAPLLKHFRSLVNAQYDVVVGDDLAYVENFQGVCAH